MPVRLVKVTSNNEALAARLVTLQEGKDYEIQITPSDTSKSAMATIKIETDTPQEKPFVFTAFAMVKAR